MNLVVNEYDGEILKSHDTDKNKEKKSDNSILDENKQLKKLQIQQRTLCNSYCSSRQLTAIRQRENDALTQNVLFVKSLIRLKKNTVRQIQKTAFYNEECYCSRQQSK